MRQSQLFNIALNPNDVIYTADWAAQDMVEHFKPSGSILEPCKGGGVFLKYLPPQTEWCEIEEGKDFFSWHKQVDWCFGNPPYSIFTDWLIHSFEVAENSVYLIPNNKVFTASRANKIYRKYGHPCHMRFLGTGKQLGFTFGFDMCAVHFKRGYFGGMSLSFAERRRTPLAPDKWESAPSTGIVPPLSLSTSQSESTPPACG